jgi:hypothetical protein
MFPNGQPPARPPMPPQGGAPAPQAAPPQGGPPQGAPPQGGAPQAQQLPPEIAKHIDPNNAIQMLLLQRVDKLTPQDGAALQQGISPQAAEVLKKIIPEVGFLIDQIHEGQMGAAPGGAPPPGPGAPQPGAPPPGMPPQGAPGQPQMQPRPSGLNRF